MDISEEKRKIGEAQKNPQAFGQLYDEFYKPILNYILRRTSDIELAQDLTSQTFFKALKGLKKFRWQNIPFSAWLYKIATNEVNDFYRRKNRIIQIRLGKIPEIQSQNYSDSDLKLAEAELENKKEFKVLSRKIRRLPLIYQTVIVLRFFEEKKISEISQISGKSEGTIKSQLHRALEALRKEMEK